VSGHIEDYALIGDNDDPQRGRLAGDFPQAFTHVALINTAHNLTRVHGPAHHRQERTP
jgi:GH15 family glucan-1,4-alpha-glucosidase